MASRSLVCAGVLVTTPVWASLAVLAGASLSGYKFSEPHEPAPSPPPAPAVVPSPGPQPAVCPHCPKCHECHECPSPRPCPPPKSCPAPAPTPRPTPAPAPKPEPKLPTDVKELHEQLQEEREKAEDAEHRVEESDKERSELKEQIKALEAKLSTSEAKVAEAEAGRKRAEASAAQAEQEVADLQGRMEQKQGPLLSWLTGFSSQGTLALFVGIVGLLGVAGPMTYVHVFKAAVASAVGGLLFVSCTGFLFSAPEGSAWSDAAEELMTGQGGFLENTVWLAMLAAGVVRWYMNWEWVLYAVVDDMYMTRPMADCYMKAPLLAAEPEQYQPPVAKDGDAASGGADAPAPQADVDQQPEAASGLPEDRGLERLLQLVRQAGESGADRAGGDWFLRFWADVANQLRQGDVADEVVVALINHGFNPENLYDSQPPPLLHLYQTLEELRLVSGGHLGAGQLAASSHLQDDMLVDEV